jgi:hypothetical protein
MLKLVLVMIVTSSGVVACTQSPRVESRSQSQATAAPLTLVPPDPPQRSPRPSLSGSGEEAKRNAIAFVEWTSASRASDEQEIRDEIHRASDNRDVAQALADEAFRAQTIDYSRTLVTLAVLGEMQSPHALGSLVSFLWQPLPAANANAEGEDIERSALERLEAKAVNGLAYLRSDKGDAEVLRAIATHDSVTVRAEAIAAYLWNHNNDEQARALLVSVVRPSDRIFLDRVRRDPNETADSFNAKVEHFLKIHPELMPPDPVKAPTTEKTVTTE